MIPSFNPKVLDKIKEIFINDYEYQSHSALIKFFIELGFAKDFCEEHSTNEVLLEKMLLNINGSQYIEKCIIKLLSPIRFTQNFHMLEQHIEQLNQFLVFDHFKIVRNGREIVLQQANVIDFERFASGIEKNDFLVMEFDDISIEKLDIEEKLSKVLNKRIVEIKKCLTIEAFLSVIFLAGSTLEGILLGIANKHPKKFNTAKSAPKGKDSQVKKFFDWKLNDLINVAHEVGLINNDVKKYSHSLRDFRNYIHPSLQVSSNSNPDKETANISCHVLKTAISQLETNMNGT